jgi:hypothetical protein
MYLLLISLRRHGVYIILCINRQWLKSQIALVSMMQLRASHRPLTWHTYCCQPHFQFFTMRAGRIPSGTCFVLYIATDVVFFLEEKHHIYCWQKACNLEFQSSFVQIMQDRVCVTNPLYKKSLLMIHKLGELFDFCFADKENGGPLIHFRNFQK